MRACAQAAQCERCPASTIQLQDSFTGSTCSPASTGLNDENNVDIGVGAADDAGLYEDETADAPAAQARRQLPFGRAAGRPHELVAGAAKDGALQIAKQRVIGAEAVVAPRLTCPPGPGGIALTGCYFTDPVTGRYAECVDARTDLQACGRCGNDCA